ncbi:hypothetical protein GCM10022284_70390 [Streptomyces hundungensis]
MPTGPHDVAFEVSDGLVPHQGTAGEPAFWGPALPGEANAAGHVMPSFPPRAPEWHEDACTGHWSPGVVPKQAIRERVGKRGMSASEEGRAAADRARQPDERIADFDKNHGPVGPGAVPAERAKLTCLVERQLRFGRGNAAGVGRGCGIAMSQTWDRPRG